MPIKIRLRRMGRKKQPHYRVVVADIDSPRDGRFIETLGYYKPLSNPARLVLDLERVDYWEGKGAQPSTTVSNLVKKARKGGDDTVAIGEVDPRQMCTNDAASPGDRLILTKGIGTGIIATAIKSGKATQVSIEAATRSMAALNRDATEVMSEFGIRCATDVTGFGLLGHLRQMARASGVSARIDAESIPFLPGAWALAQTERFPGGTIRNLADVTGDVVFSEEIPETLRHLLADAQTSGGLLMAVPEEVFPDILAALTEKVHLAGLIGEVEEGPPGRIQVT